jgi:hypothetical protein
MKSLFLLFCIIILAACTESSVNNSPEKNEYEFEGSPPQDFIDSSKTIKITWQKIKYGGYNVKIFKSEIPLMGINWIKTDDFNVTRKDTFHYKKLLIYPLFEAEYIVDLEYSQGFLETSGMIKQYNIFGGIVNEYIWDTKLSSFSTAIVKRTSMNGYEYDEVTEFWSIFCSNYPCGPWVIVPPVYSQATAHKVKIKGLSEPVIVQIWKGFCPRVLDFPADTISDDYLMYRIYRDGRINHPQSFMRYNLGENFPGGVGAEVGIYQENNSTAFWMPYVTDKVRIKFMLINPETKDTVVNAEELSSWWRTKWMTTESYESYSLKNGTMINPLDYELHYWLNGAKQPVWKSNDFSGEIK